MSSISEVNRARVQNKKAVVLRRKPHNGFDLQPLWGLLYEL